MRTLAPTLAVLLLLALAGQAQPPLFTQSYQVRGAVGDIPTTEATEAAGQWNLEQRLTLTADNASEQRVHFGIPSGSQLTAATCDCPNYSSNQTGSIVTFTVPAGAPATRTLRVTTRQPFDSTLGFSLNLPLQASSTDAVVILYVPIGSEVDGAVGTSSPGVTTDGAASIHYAKFTEDRPMPTDLWFTIHPEGGTGTARDTGASEGLPWLFLALGAAAGAIAWALLVRGGVVQKKSRRQLVATAGHVEAAASESPAVLEGRKRALMAALKEVELARQANEMPVEVYDLVKADLKKQAVTVMRALEASQPADKSA